jgi:hypothetical protein
MSAWMIERKEFGYRPITDGKWELDSCMGYGQKSFADAMVACLQESADEYTQYRAVEYVRKEGSVA